MEAMPHFLLAFFYTICYSLIKNIGNVTDNVSGVYRKTYKEDKK